MSGDGDDVRMGFGDSGGDGADSSLGDELDVYFCVRIRILKIEDELREVFDGVDVVMRRRRNQRHARSRMPHLGDVLADLASGKLPAFAGLRTLCDLDLEFGTVDEVVNRHPETSGGDLLDFADRPVAVFADGITCGVLPAFAAVAARAQAVHRDGQRFMRFLADRAERHRSGCKALHDLGNRFDLCERNRLHRSCESQHSA